MEVILQENYPSLGYVGDKVRVRSGYARNFLVPRGIAVEASSRNAKLVQHKVAAIQAKRAKLKNEAIEFGKRFEGIVLEFTLKAGEQGKSFGSISNKDIDAALKKHGIEVERKQIRIVDSIRTAGDHKAEVKLHSEVVVAVTVRVVQEKIVERNAEDGEGRKDGRRRKGRSAKNTSESVEAGTAENGSADAVEAGAEGDEA